MRVGENMVELIGEIVRIQRNAVTTASGRWRGGHVIDRSGRLDPLDDDAAWKVVESALRRESDAFLAAAVSGAYDEHGVDITQIDRMLSLTPTDRLAVLDGERRSIARLLSDAPRD